MVISVYRYLFQILVFALCFVVTGAQASSLHDEWDQLLNRHVENGSVDYIGFKTEQHLLDKYLDQLAETDPASLNDRDRLAYYINSYNSYTIKLILENFRDGKPVESIKDIGGWFTSPWSIKFVRIGGQLLTLDDLEHEIIRKEFNEPRIHFAVNCASRSCPPLLNRAYRGDDLEQTLTRVTADFLSDSRFTTWIGSELHVSKIFRWYKEDFPAGIRDFVYRYGDTAMRQRIGAAGNELSIHYLDYDWSLNLVQQ